MSGVKNWPSRVLIIEPPAPRCRGCGIWPAPWYIGKTRWCGECWAEVTGGKP